MTKVKTGKCRTCGKEYNYVRGDGNSSIRCGSCYFRRHCRKVKLRAVEYKGGQCQLCGYKTCVDAMIFHHSDPNEKDFEISKFKHKRWDLIRIEIDKCMLLCANCHQEIHYREDRRRKIMDYIKNPTLLIPNIIGDIECIICDKHLSKIINIGRYRSGLCGSCRQAKHQLSIQIKCISYLGAKCLDCSYDSCISALCFHHRDENSKSFEISQAHTSNWDILQPELDKCDLLCFNCHAIKHYEEQL